MEEKIEKIKSENLQTKDIALWKNITQELQVFFLIKKHLTDDPKEKHNARME